MSEQVTVEAIKDLQKILRPHLVGNSIAAEKAVNDWAKKHTSSNKGKFYTACEVAEKFEVSLYTIRRWRKSGKIPYVKHNCRNYRYPKDKIDSLIKDGLN